MVVRRLGLKQNSLIMLDADPHRKNFGRSPRNASPTRPSTVPTSPGRKGRPVSIPYSSKTRAKGETPTKPSLTPVVPGDRVYARQHCPQIRSVLRAECSVRCRLQLNIDLVASATADTWQQSELRGTIGSSTQRSPILAVRALSLAKATSKPRLLILTRAQRTPSYQSHADGGARLPAGMEQLQEMGMIETLRPKLVVNWDLASPPRAGTPRGGQSPRGGGTPRVLSVPSQPSLPAAGYQACGRLDSPRGVSALSISSVGAPSPFDRRR